MFELDFVGWMVIALAVVGAVYLLVEAGEF